MISECNLCRVAIKFSTSQYQCTILFKCSNVLLDLLYTYCTHLLYTYCTLIVHLLYTYCKVLATTTLGQFTLLVPSTSALQQCTILVHC